MMSSTTLSTRLCRIPTHHPHNLPMLMPPTSSSHHGATANQPYKSRQESPSTMVLASLGSNIMRTTLTKLLLPPPHRPIHSSPMQTPHHTTAFDHYGRRRRCRRRSRPQPPHYPSSLNAQLVRRRLRHIAMRGSIIHSKYFYGR